MEVSSQFTEPGQMQESLQDSVKRPLQLRWLLTVFLFELSLMTWLVLRDPFLSYQVFSHIRPVRQISAPVDTEQFKKDPLIDLVLPTTAIGNSIRTKATKSTNGYMLVPVGDCASCVKADLVGWQRECNKLGISFVLVTTAKEEVAKTFLRRLRLNAPIVCDPAGTINKSLNVIWFGRPYLFSSDWKLLWLQSQVGSDNPFTDKSFLQTIKAVNN